MDNAPRIEALTVTALNEYIKTLLDTDDVLAAVAVRGEISNFKNHYQTGHFYFTLKDSGGCIAAVMFRSYASRLKFVPSDGMKAVLFGHVSSYVKSGQYQIYVTDMIPDGAGALYLRFEQLKERLGAEGLFDASRKRPIPKYPERIGVVTSPTGAAIQDILNILGRRFPYAAVTLYPALVQGEGAEASVVAGIEYFNGLDKNDAPDVLIIGRGGGSIEDLWAFNERMVAQAVFDCSVPIISAVGHETDTTIIDYVADLRAPTPSAAAELAVTQVSDIENEILDRQDRLYQRMGRVLQHKRQQADQMEMRLKYLSPASRIREKRTYSIQLEDRLQNRLQAILRERRHNLALYIERMKAVSPLEKLNSGFSYVEDTDGKNIRSVIQVEAGERLRIRVSDGVIDTRVEQIQKEERLPG